MACHLSWLRPRAFGLLPFVVLRVCASLLAALGELRVAIFGFAVAWPAFAIAVNKLDLRADFGTVGASRIVQEEAWELESQVEARMGRRCKSSPRLCRFGWMCNSGFARQQC